MAIANDAKLRIYNGALVEYIGSRRLASLTEEREPRRILDDIWANGKMVKYALQRGEWNFAIRTVQASYTSSVEPSYGFRRAYTKPDDFERLAAMSDDEYFRTSLTAADYSDEAGYWFSDRNTLYVRFVSSANNYGFNSSLWTEGFEEYLKAYAAIKAVGRISNSRSAKAEIEKAMTAALKTAKSNDAMNEGAKSLPQGSWSRSRGSYGSRFEHRR